MMKRQTIIAICLPVLVVIGMMLAWRSYDPTVLWSDSEDKLPDLVTQTSSGRVDIVEYQSEPFRPDKVAFLVRYHPRYIQPLRDVSSGFPDSSSSIAAETPDGRLRCYSHFFRRRTAAFTVVSSSRNACANRLIQELKTVFPGLPVHVLHSESQTMEDPTSARTVRPQDDASSVQ